jgi:branched-chain amino acid transport system permease protein
MLAAPEGLFWEIRDRWLHRPAPPQIIKERASSLAVSVPSGTLLEVKGVSKAFGGLRAVQDVGFSVAAGEILGIIGPNGAGKTTLFNLLNGVLPADAGSAHFGSHELRGRKVHEVARLGIGRTFQVVRSFPRLSLLDNVIVGGYGAGLDDHAAAAAAEAALEEVGLADRASRPASELTNKELRLMELARALAGRPRLLLLDETLAGLGREECDDLLAVLRDLRAGGMTIVIIEHTMHAMLRLADRFLVLDHGAVLAEGLPHDVVENQAVIEAYLGSKFLAQHKPAVQHA